MLYSTALTPPSSRYHTTIPMFSASLQSPKGQVCGQAQASAQHDSSCAAVSTQGSAHLLSARLRCVGEMDQAHTHDPQGSPLKVSGIPILHQPPEFSHQKEWHQNAHRHRGSVECEPQHIHLLPQHLQTRTSAARAISPHSLSLGSSEAAFAIVEGKRCRKVNSSVAHLP